jgi:serine-type D-Ala-D-Ala carboxypeptidase
MILLLLGALAAWSPGNCARRAVDWTPLGRLLDSAVAAGAAPGAVVGVSRCGERYTHGTGRLGLMDSIRPGPGTLYDLASLTKVVGLTTAVMLAVEDGLLRLDDPVQRYLPVFLGPRKDSVTLRHLLTHSSGLPAHRPLWLVTPHWSTALLMVNTMPLDTAPGVRALYSDLGAIVLTEVVERVYRTSLDRVLTARVFGPLGMRGTRFRPPRSWRAWIAPTEDDPWRGRVLRGEVHDENAAWLGGISGHAGLFSDVEDLLTFGEWLLDGVTGGPGSDGGFRPWAVPPPRVAAEFVRRQNLVAGSSRALGWDTPSEGSSAGTRLSPASYGHTGFTGTSIWTDPARGLVVVLLTNRVHPTRANTAHVALRPAVADLAADLADGRRH